MYRRDFRDMAGGLLAIAAGAFAFFYTLAHYNLGTLSHPGAGMFPAALGVVMVVMGGFVMVPALLRSGEALDVNIRPTLAVLAGIAAFALMIGRFGLVPAIVATVVLSSLAEARRNYLVMALLAAALTAVGILVFVVGLGLSIPLFAWRP